MNFQKAGQHQQSPLQKNVANLVQDKFVLSSHFLAISGIKPVEPIILSSLRTRF